MKYPEQYHYEKANTMKTLFKIPVLLLALMLVVSCGNEDNKKNVLKETNLNGKVKSDDSGLKETVTDLGIKYGELMCKIQYYGNLKDKDSLQIVQNKLEEYANQLERTYGKNLENASSEFMSEFKAAITSVIDKCPQ